MHATLAIVASALSFVPKLAGAAVVRDTSVAPTWHLFNCTHMVPPSPIESTQDFCDIFTSWCVNDKYEDASDPNWINWSAASDCKVGDKNGQNSATEVRAWCTFSDKKSTVDFTLSVVGDSSSYLEEACPPVY